MAKEILVDIRGAQKRFMGAKVLDNVTLQIYEGDHIAVMGPNGAGKTTLVRSMLGFYHLDGGTIRIAGHDPVRERVLVLKEIGFIPQLPPPIKLTLNELLHFVERSTGTQRSDVAAKAAEIIGCKTAIPMHYGTIIGDKSDAEHFKDICSCNVKILGDF
jgi:ABC-2 type transport system ATP-binding protein